MKAFNLTSIMQQINATLSTRPNSTICNLCLQESANLKAKLSPEVIQEVTNFEIDICIKTTKRHDAQGSYYKCLSRVIKQKEDVTFLLHNDCQQFCKYIEACGY